MRHVQLAVNRPMPKTTRQWFDLSDRLRHDWTASSRKRLNGRVKVSIIWHDRLKHSLEEEAGAAVELIGRLDFMLSETAEPYIGLARSEQGYPRLYLVLEGE